MKKIFIGRLVVILLVAITPALNSAQAQTAEITPSVSVTGSARVTTLPDEIYLTITLDESDTKGRLPLEQQRQKMFAALKKAGVDAEKQLSVLGMSSNYFRRRQALASTQYELKLSSAEAVRKVFDALDEAGVPNVSVTRTAYSDMEGLQREARQKAMLNAQSRARELAEAVGQSIGACYEINDYTTTAVETTRRKAVLMANAAMDMATAEAEPEVEFEQIVLSYNVSAKFYLNTK